MSLLSNETTKCTDDEGTLCFLAERFSCFGKMSELRVKNKFDLKKERCFYSAEPLCCFILLTSVCIQQQTWVWMWTCVRGRWQPRALGSFWLRADTARDPFSKLWSTSCRRLTTAWWERPGEWAAPRTGQSNISCRGSWATRLNQSAVFFSASLIK